MIAPTNTAHRRGVPAPGGVSRLHLAGALVLLATGCSAGDGGGGPPPSGSPDPAAGNGGEPAAGGAGPVTSTAGAGADPNVAAGGAPVEPAAGGGQNTPSVVFDWPEGSAGIPGESRAGLYQGAFDGIYVSDAAFGILPVPVTGNVNVTLAESTNGEFFEVSDGAVDGLANGLFPFSGNISGELDCLRAHFEAILDGSYTVAPNPTPYLFSGPITAAYDKQAFRLFNGTWNVAETGSLGQQIGGNGTWWADLVP